jgi:hypothetical protein
MCARTPPLPSHHPRHSRGLRALSTERCARTKPPRRSPVPLAATAALAAARAASPHTLPPLQPRRHVTASRLLEALEAPLIAPLVEGVSPPPPGAQSRRRGHGTRLWTPPGQDNHLCGLCQSPAAPAAPWDGFPVMEAAATRRHLPSGQRSWLPDSFGASLSRQGSADIVPPSVVRLRVSRLVPLLSPCAVTVATVSVQPFQKKRPKWPGEQNSAT